MNSLPERVANCAFAEREFSYGRQETMLYAVAVGLGRDLPAERDFVYEPHLQVLPTQAAVVAWDDGWIDRLGLDRSRILHGAMEVSIHAPLLPEGCVRSNFHVDDVIDKGRDKGAILETRTELSCALRNVKLATLRSTVIARGEGGFGGASRLNVATPAMPPRDCDTVLHVDVRPEQAALYRLCGDRNPLHVDHAAARAAGFEQPILHGLCTWGMVAAQVVRVFANRDATRLKFFHARFVAPVFARDTLMIEAWREENGVTFRAHARGRGLVLDRGRAGLDQPASLFTG